MIVRHRHIDCLQRHILFLQDRRILSKISKSTGYLLNLLLSIFPKLFFSSKMAAVLHLYICLCHSPTHTVLLFSFFFFLFFFLFLWQGPSMALSKSAVQKMLLTILTMGIPCMTRHNCSFTKGIVLVSKQFLFLQGFMMFWEKREPGSSWKNDGRRGKFYYRNYIFNQLSITIDLWVVSRP